MTKQAIILFDGVCVLCERSVQFVIKRDSQRVFKFAALQSSVAENLLTQYRLEHLNLTSMVLIEEDEAFLKSDAALRVCLYLDKPWPYLYFLRWIPRFIRNPVYDFIGARRYRWFGKKQCMILPVEEQKMRFLDV